MWMGKNFKWIVFSILAVPFMCIFSFCGLVWSQSGKSSVESTAITDYVIVSDGAGAAVDEATLDSMIEFVKADDKVGVGQLLDMNRVFVLEGGTKVKELKTIGFFDQKTKIRVMSGSHYGEIAWILYKVMETP